MFSGRNTSFHGGTQHVVSFVFGTFRELKLTFFELQ